MGTRPQRRPILNCDDFGSMLRANEAVDRALRRGIARSATVMVPCPWALDAVLAATAHPEWGVGVHLTLTSEWDRYPWRPLSGAERSTLRDPEGFLWHSSEGVRAHADPGEALAECVLQVERAMAWGLAPTHPDTHMGVLEAPGPWIGVFGDAARRFDLPVRLVDASLANALPEVRVLTRFAFRPPRARAGQALFANALPPGVTETAMHPCPATPERAVLPPAQAFRADEARLLGGEDADDFAAALVAASVETTGCPGLIRT